VSLTGDTAMPTLITLPGGHQDGSKKRQFVHLPANQKTSVKSCVATKVNETSAEDLVQRNSKDKALPDQKRMRNDLYPETSASHTEQIPKSTHQNASLGVITTQNDQMWLSKSTDQAFNYKSRENVIHGALGPQIEGNASSISSYHEETPRSLTLKDINTETQFRKPKEDVQCHVRVEHTSNPTAKTPRALQTSSTSVNCYPSLISVTSKAATSRSDEVLVFRLPSSAASKSTTVPFASNNGIEKRRPDGFEDKTNSTSHLPLPYKYKKPDATRSVPHITKNGLYNLDDSLGRHASSKRVLLTVDDPVRPASDSDPFSVRRLLSSHKPSQKSQVTSASSCFPSHQHCDISKQGNPSGTPFHNYSSRNGGIVRDNNPVKSRSTSDTSHHVSTRHDLHISTESSQATNTPSRLSFPHGCGQRSSIVRTSSSVISTAGRHNSTSLIAPSNGKSPGQELFDMQGAPLQTTQPGFSQSFYKHNEQRQNIDTSNGPSTDKICTSNSSRQNSAHTQERKSHFHPAVIKIAEKTPQNRKLPVATVQAMTTLSNSLCAGNSVAARERLNISHDHSEPLGNRHHSTEKTTKVQQWRHRDPKIQAKQKSYNEEALHLPGSTSSLLTPSTTSENSDLQTFVTYLTEPALKEQGLETSLDIGQEGHLLEMRTCDSLQAQQVEIFQNQSMRIWTHQSDDHWMSDKPNRMGMTKAPDIHESVTDRDIRPNYDDNMLQNLLYSSSGHSPVDKQCIPVGYTSSTVHWNPKNSLHHQHCPTRHTRQFQLFHHRKRKPRSLYRQYHLT